MKYDGIIFDLDGTLWDSSEGVLYTWDQVLRAQPDVTHIPGKAELESVMGLGAEELTSLINEDHGAELSCHFCNRTFRFTEKQLVSLLEQATR